MSAKTIDVTLRASTVASLRIANCVSGNVREISLRVAAYPVPTAMTMAQSFFTSAFRRSMRSFASPEVTVVSRLNCIFLAATFSPA